MFLKLTGQQGYPILINMDHAQYVKRFRIPADVETIGSFIVLDTGEDISVKEPIEVIMARVKDYENKI